MVTEIPQDPLYLLSHTISKLMRADLGPLLWHPKYRDPGILSFFERGVSNGPIQFESARKIWPLLKLLAKIR